MQLSVKYSDFTAVTRRVTLEAPTDDGQTLYREARALLRKVDLRKKVRSAGGRYQVIKNKLARLGTQGTSFEQFAKNLKGPQAGGSPEEAVLAAIREGLHKRDPAMLGGVYADDVEYTIINRNNPPSKRLVLRGRKAVQEMFAELCAREMSHKVMNPVAGANAIAYSIHCSYPDGCNVVGLYNATLRDGRIVSEISVDCWDE